MQQETVGDMATKVVWKGLNVFEKNVFDSYVAAQSNLLVNYAVNTVQEIGDTIKQYNSRNHFDRTGNLLDSLCWCLTYRGTIVGSGYYQNKATVLSYLHEFDEDFEAYPVGGHTLAELYIQRYGKTSVNGWRLVIAIFAPYWGYWEHGFNMKVKGKSFGIRKFAVMTQFFDKVTKDLSPANVTFRNNVPTYTNAKYTLHGKYKNYSSGKSNPYKKYPRKRYHH